MKKLIIFDLDGTLARSKSPIDDEMSELLKNLLEVQQGAIISGGGWPQFKKQVLDRLPKETLIKKLAILPTCDTKFYRYENDQQILYAENFTEKERKKILDNLNIAVDTTNLNIKKTWGDQIEDRGSQITFSALGQQAPLKKKKVWDKD